MNLNEWTPDHVCFLAALFVLLVATWKFSSTNVASTLDHLINKTTSFPVCMIVVGVFGILYGWVGLYNYCNCPPQPRSFDHPGNAIAAPILCTGIALAITGICALNGTFTHHDE